MASACCASVMFGFGTLPVEKPTSEAQRIGSLLETRADSATYAQCILGLLLCFWRQRSFGFMRVVMKCLKTRATMPYKVLLE